MRGLGGRTAASSNGAERGAREEEGQRCGMRKQSRGNGG